VIERAIDGDDASVAERTVDHCIQRYHRADGRTSATSTERRMQRTHVRRVRSLTVFASLAIAAGCASAPAPALPPSTAGRPGFPATTPSTVRPASVNAVAVAEEMIVRTNAARRAAGLTGLAKSVNLMSAAQIQAEQMVKAGRMEHELPGQPYPTLKARLAAVQYNVRAAGENIAEGQRSAAEALATWMDSLEHRANILSRDYTEIGTAVAVARNGRLYFVQVFGRPARTSSTLGPLVRTALLF
jgi:uncharacterized protein YkwD